MTAADLDHHTCIAVTGLGRNPDWPMRIGGKVAPVQLKRAHSCDSADVVRDLAIAGFGLCRLARFLIGDALDDGRLVSVLDDIHASETVPIAAVMPPGRQHLPRVRVFLDFLIAAAA
jgi:DNA-binding transcriptional LysR family regulator